MSWSLVTYRRGTSLAIGVRLGDGTVVAPPELERWPTLLALLDDWASARTVLVSLDPQTAPAADADELVTPIQFPRKVLCAGVNYRRHIREMGGEVPGDEWKPFFFMKPPTTTVIGPTDPILVPPESAARLDWEAELAVVIGVGGRGIAVGDALSHVAGYTVANDVTARGYHRRSKDAIPTDAFLYDWFSSKAVDSSLPLGPGIVPDFLVPDPQDLRLRLWVNDVLHQDETTGDMICTVAELIAAASATVTLEPGDVIPTGTPSGVGSSQGLQLRAGDVVRTSIDGFGALVNPVINA